MGGRQRNRDAPVQQRGLGERADNGAPVGAYTQVLHQRAHQVLGLHAPGDSGQLLSPLH